MRDTFLHEVLVVELGERSAVGACGSLLAELGATVVLAEPRALPDAPDSKWAQRALAATGKRSVVFDADAAADVAHIRKLLARADVVLTSSDVDPRWIAPLVAPARESAIVCDITAFGSSGPLAGEPYRDLFVQAISGVIDTSGEPDGAPVRSHIPVTESSAGLYALSGVLAALRVRDQQGAVQAVEVAMFDCAVSALTTFLPAYFTGKVPQRVGNHHPSMSPWNAYRATDGWVMLCAGSDDMWRKVCAVIEQPALADDPRYATPTDRVRVNARIDGIVEAWTRQHPVAECVSRLAAAGLPCGPIHTIDELFSEASLVHRGLIRTVHDDAAGTPVRVPGVIFLGSAARGLPPQSVHAPDADRAWLSQMLARPAALRAARTPRAPLLRPLAGVRIVEMGTYTTAPLCARQLAALGGEVVKVEPPIGDPARVLPPLREGQGYFFTMNNSDKRAVTIDLRLPQGKAELRELLAHADVFVDNLKPGSLARLGFGGDELASINPRLIHCSVSGFGADSPLADRPGMDTTIQGMAGIMDLTRAGGTPYKTGISIADLTGAQLSLAVVFAALAYRERTGRGGEIDLSMQDAGAWLTRGAWNGERTAAQTTLVACSDGWAVAAAAPADVLRAAMPASLDGTAPEQAVRSAASRAVLVKQLGECGIAAAPVLRVDEAVEQPQARARALIVTGTAQDGVQWPLLASPIRLALTPALVQRPPGPAESSAASAVRDWAQAASAAA